MDAFAVALATSLNLPRLTGRHLFRFGFHFGLFQALMPICGWLAGMGFRRYIEDYDHWLAFGLLAAVGGKMLWEALHPDHEERSPRDPTRGWSLVMLSIATSIDALAVGLTFAMLDVTVWFPALLIGVTACLLTLIGMGLGRRIGARWGSRFEVIGGLLLIAIGAKILFEHTLLS